MAIDAVAFTDALGLRSYDLHGFSMGGFVANELLTLFFERTDTSRAKGQEFIQRIFTRTQARDDSDQDARGLLLVGIRHQDLARPRPAVRPCRLVLISSGEYVPRRERVCS